MDKLWGTTALIYVNNIRFAIMTINVKFYTKYKDVEVLQLASSEFWGFSLLKI